MPDLGRLEVCLNVKKLERTLKFYNNLGFRKVAGKPEDGWAILERDGFRIDLFEGHIKENVLNFRGGDVPRIVGAVRGRGMKPFDVKHLGGDGSGRAMLRDPDGNLLFFDTTPRERTVRKKARAGR
jgi:catechol 2,3-dioxygenase-like lactoylglutathione lyase family enzyme